MSKIQFNQTSKEGTQLVCDYVYNHMNNKGLRYHYADLIAPKKAALQSITENPLKTLTPEENADLRQKYAEEISALKAECDKLAEQYKYTATDADKALKKAVRTAETEAQLCTAIATWLGQFGLKTVGTDCTFAHDVIKRAGHKVDYKKFVATEGAECTDTNDGNLLKMAYFALYEALVCVKYVKAVDVPAFMKEHFDAIEARRLARIEARKAKKADK